MSYSFYVTIQEDGRSFPGFSVFPPKYGEYLGCLSGRTSIGSIEQDIQSIKEVVYGKKPFVWITGGGDCKFEVRPDLTTLTGFYNEFVPISLPTSFFLSLHED